MSYNDAQFPHLNDTEFPNLSNMDVYRYQNTFDYKRWADGTRIYLCNVLFNSDYKDVVKFKNDVERDNYFDKLNSYTVELKTRFHVAPDNSVKIPVPYTVASKYNYLYVDLPTMTSDNEPINYESNRREHRYFYFINDVVQLAPSSTMLIVAIDNWTTFINDVDIPYIMLERGHAPMHVTNVEQYLNNPIENNQYLLAPDFDFANGVDSVKTSEFVPVNNGEKYIMFATTMSESQVKAQKYPDAINGNTTPATFSNANARNGYQYIVNGYDWNLGDYDYNNMQVDSTPMHSFDGSIPNNTTVIAVKASNARPMFEYMSEHIPFFYKTIMACFMVDDTMFNKGEQFTFCNVTCFTVRPASDSIIHTLKLTKDKFGYNTKYAKITKLYTYPYAHIEVTDNNGNVKTFRIENTSNVEMHKDVSLAFPYLSIQTYLTGINGSGYADYKWQNINATSVNHKMYADDFGDYLWNWGIPTYALYVKSYDVYKADNYPSQYVNRYNAIAEYHKSVGMANTQYQNSVDAADNTKAMTNNSASTENTNAINMAGTINTNNVDSANTGQSNANASANTAKTNTDNNANTLVTNTAVETAKCADLTTKGNANSSMVTSENNTLNSSNVAYDIGMTMQTTDIENQQTITTGVSNGITAAVGGVSSAMGNAGAGNIPGMIGSLVYGAAQLANAGVSTWATTTANAAIADATIGNNRLKLQAATGVNTSITTATNAYNDAVTEVSNNAAITKTNNSANTMKTNATNTQTTEKANAQRTRDTSVGNANRTKDTSIGNANRTLSNSNTNAQLNRNLTVANSGYTREQTVDNAKITLEQRRIENLQNYRSKALSNPIAYGSTNGDMTLDAFERRGLQVKIKTELDGYIAQAGDLMLRYGYALNQVWDIGNSGLTLMKYFTYWKASDIWINEGAGVNQGAQQDIKSAFENGVTVWDNPDKIGKVSIYDN